MTFDKLVQDDTTTMKTKDEESVNIKGNIAVIVNIVAIVILLKSNESYSKIIVNFPKNSANEILKLKNIYECKIKNNNTARYIDAITPSQVNKYYITSNNFVFKNGMIGSSNCPGLNINVEIGSVLESTTGNNCVSISKKTIDKSEFNNLQSYLTNTLFSSLPFSNNYSKTGMMIKTCERNLKHETSIESKFKFKTYLPNLIQIKQKFNSNVNKLLTFNSTVYGNVKLNNINESKITLKNHSPDCRMKRRKSTIAEIFSERIYVKTTCEILPGTNNFSINEERSYGIIPSTRALATKMIKYNKVPQNNISMNMQKKVTLRHNLNRITHNLPTQRSINKSMRKGKLKNKWQRSMVGFVQQPGGIKTRKVTLLLNRIIDRRMNVTPTNKLLQEVKHINTIPGKMVTSELIPMESSSITVEQLRFGPMSDSFILTKGIPKVKQLPTKISMSLQTNDHQVPMSKQSLQFVSDVERNSSVGSNLKTPKNIILTDEFTKYAGQTITDKAFHEINEIDEPQSTKDIMSYKLQTVNRSEYLSSFKDLVNSNSNISLRSMPQAFPKDFNRNKTLKNPKKMSSTKRLVTVGKPFKITKLHEKIKTNKISSKVSKRMKMHRKIQTIKFSKELSKQNQVNKVNSINVTTHKNLKGKKHVKLKPTPVPGEIYRTLKQNQKTRPTEVLLIKAIKQKQNRKMLSTKVTAKKSLNQKSHMKLKITTVAVEKYKLSKLNNHPTEVSLIKSSKQKHAKKMQPVKVTAKKSVKQKQNTKVKFASVSVKKYKISTQNKMILSTKISSIQQKQRIHVQPTKVIAMMTVKQKKHKKLKLTVSHKKYKISKYNKNLNPTKMILNRFKTTIIQRKNDKIKFSYVSLRSKYPKKKPNTEKPTGLKNVKITEKMSKHRNSSGKKQSKSKSQSKKLNIVNIKSIERIMTANKRQTTLTSTSKITNADTLSNGDGDIEENVFLINTTFVLSNRSAEIRNNNEKESRDLYWTQYRPFNSYNFYNTCNHNSFLYVSSAITDRNIINNLIIVDFDTTAKYTTTSTPCTYPPPHQTPVTKCPNPFYPTITFLKRTGFLEFNVILTAIFLGAVVLLIICCCCCGPIIVVSKKVGK